MPIQEDWQIYFGNENCAASEVENKLFECCLIMKKTSYWLSAR